MTNNCKPLTSIKNAVQTNASELKAPLAKSLKIVDALEFSNKVAGISTTKEGAANSMPSINEVENY